MRIEGVLAMLFLLAVSAVLAWLVLSALAAARRGAWLAPSRVRGLLVVVAGLCALGCGFVAWHIVSDVQIILAAVLGLGAVVCLGLATVVGLLGEIRSQSGDGVATKRQT